LFLFSSSLCTIFLTLFFICIDCVQSAAILYSLYCSFDLKYNSILLFGLAMFYISDFFFELKVYTCISDAVLSQFIPTSTPKFRYYKDNIVSYALFEELAKKLYALKQQVCTFKQIINVQKYIVQIRLKFLSLHVLSI
jgi:hypothetical protein